MMREEYRTHLISVLNELSEKPADGLGRNDDVEDPGDSKKDENPKDKEPKVKLDDIAVDTRLKHVDSGYEYTVLGVSVDSAQLSNPESQEITVDKKTLEQEYVVD